MYLDSGLHPLDGEEGGEVGGEGGQHQDDEEPVGRHEDAPRQRLGRLPAALRRQRGQGVPEALTQVEVPSARKTHELPFTYDVGTILEL